MWNAKQSSEFHMTIINCAIKNRKANFTSINVSSFFTHTRQHHHHQSFKGAPLKLFNAVNSYRSIKSFHYSTFPFVASLLSVDMFAYESVWNTSDTKASFLPSASECDYSRCLQAKEIKSFRPQFIIKIIAFDAFEMIIVERSLGSWSDTLEFEEGYH